MNKLKISVVSLSLAVFFCITFILCVVFDLLFPSLAMNKAWTPYFPGFVWLNVGSFLLGLIESFIYGIYTGVVFVPIYNYFQKRFQKSS